MPRVDAKTNGRLHGNRTSKYTTNRGFHWVLFIRCTYIYNLVNCICVLQIECDSNLFVLYVRSSSLLNLIVVNMH